MVSLSEVIASNGRIASSLPPGLVTVFVGGTSGVGEYTVKAFARYATKPRVYLIGRSQDAADRIIRECQQANPDGSFEFIKADISLIKVVDDVCRQIKSKETTINILFESQGSMAFSKETSEGVPFASSLVSHSRIRFILNLLPLLQNANSLRRVVSVAAATVEGPVDVNNFHGDGLPLLRKRDQTASIHTLLLEEMARRAPDVSFIHAMPGLVPSGITRDAEGLGMAIRIAVSKVILQPFLQTPPGECGERHVFLATSARYPPGLGSGASCAGVPADVAVPSIARGSDGRVGSGMYSVDNKGESAPARVEQLLVGLRDDGTGGKVWEYLAAELTRITGSIVAP